MFRIVDFEKELNRDNPHYERFKKSSLHDLVALLKRAMPRATANEVAAEMKKISPDKWSKYKNTRSYLLKKFPNLQTAVTQVSSPIGESVPGYSPGKWQRQKDDDGNWHEFILQQKGNSCGPACVTMVKLAWHPGAKYDLREPEIRGLVALFESNKQHQGISSLSPQAVGLHKWKDVGSDRDPLVKTLKAKPFPVASARGVSNLAPAAMLDELRKCSSKKPAIVGWLWQGGGGHWTVCVGPTRDKSSLIILDPWDGIQYVQNDVAGFSSYQNGQGSLDFSDPTLTH